MTGLIETEARPPVTLPLASGGFRPDVQALRGLAVLAVVAYHARLVPGGFVGVDVFFVISGFVIGRTLMSRLRREDGLSLRDFSARRARRLLPALAVMLSVVVVASPLLAPVGAGAVTARTGMAASLLHANFFLFQATRGGYFAPAAEWNPLLHTWSLSVEEQFYLVLPVALLGLWRLAKRSGNPVRVLRLGVGLVAGVSLAACVVLSFGRPGSEAVRWSFFASPTRAWEFLAGLLLVLLPGRVLAVRGLSVLRWVGLAMIVAATLVYSDTTRFPGVAALVPVAGAALVILGGRHRAGSVEAGSGWTAPAQRLGDLSYSWYLWHWPLIVAAAAFWPTAGRLPLVVAAIVSLAPAWASHRFLETRFRPAPGTGAAGAQATIRLAGICIVVPVIASIASLGVLRWVEDRPTVAPVASAEPHLAERSGCNRAAPVGSPERAGCTWGDGPTHVVLVGDSNADHFSHTLADARGRDDRLSVAVLRGCPMADVIVDATWFLDAGRDCRAFTEGSTEALLSDPPDAVVIANATDKYVEDPQVVLVDPVDGQRASAPAEKAAVFEDGLTRTVAALTGAGIRVAVIETAPKPWAVGIEFDERGCSALLLMTDPDRCTVPAFTLDEVTSAANDLEARAAEAGGATSWDLASTLCPDRRCGADGRRSVWPEAQHISVDAARGLAPSAGAALDELLGRAPG